MKKICTIIMLLVGNLGLMAQLPTQSTFEKQRDSILQTLFSTPEEKDRATTLDNFAFSQDEFDTHLLRTSAEEYLIDSIIDESYDQETENYRTNDKAFYEYDEDGNRIKRTYEQYYFDQQLDSLRLNYKYSFWYNSDGNTTRFVFYNWFPDSAKVLLTSEVHWIYDEGKLVEGIQYEFDYRTFIYGPRDSSSYKYEENGDYTAYRYGWNVDSAEFRLRQKDEFRLDDDENTIELTEYSWEASTGEWIPFKKTESDYILGNKLQERYEYEWDESILDWLPNIITEISYNQNGKETQYIIYKWEEKIEYWVQEYKNERIYDANGNLIQYAYYTKHFNSPENSIELDLAGKTEYIYDEDGNLAELILYSSTQYPGIIVPRERWKHTYDEDANRVESIIELWDTRRRDFTIWSRQTFEYDSNKSLKRIINYSWNNDESDWVFVRWTNYYYTLRNVTSIDDPYQINLKVFPNPTSSFITIDLPDHITSSTVELFAINGQKVLEQKVSDMQQLPVAHLNNGFYILKLNMDHQVLTKKILIK